LFGFKEQLNFSNEKPLHEKGLRVFNKKLKTTKLFSEELAVMFS
jgi:hypothetical protein